MCVSVCVCVCVGQPVARYVWPVARDPTRYITRHHMPSPMPPASSPAFRLTAPYRRSSPHAIAPPLTDAPRYGNTAGCDPSNGARHLPARRRHTSARVPPARVVHGDLQRVRERPTAPGQYESEGEEARRAAGQGGPVHLRMGIRVVVGGE